MYFSGTKSCLLAFCCFASLSVFGKEAKETAGQGLRKPLCFVENKGQVLDENNNPRSDIKYKLSTPGLSLFAGSGQLHYQFRKVKGSPSTSLKITGYQMDV